MLHSNIAEGDMHFIQQWTVADTTARDALSVAAADVGKVCEVGAAGAEKTFYILADDSPMTWTEIGGGGGAGDVVGPASATDNAIVRFDSTTGKLIQDSGITIADGASGTLAGTNSGDVTLNASVADIFGLTGQELTGDDPAADRIVFWDDSAGKLTHLTVGSGLTITDTTITAAGGGTTVPAINGFRLSLTTGVPVTTSDVATSTTIYCTPYKGNQISLYDGVSAWTTVSSAEFSLAVGTLTSGLNYDVFCYNNGGTATLEFTAWTDDTTRATALTYQDGILVKTGATTRRYLGTFRTISTTETCDTELKRFLYNYYHRVVRSLNRVETTASWNYTTATYRQANNSALNQVELVLGVAEDIIDCLVQVAAYATGSDREASPGIGIDSTSTNSAKTFGAIVTTLGTPLTAHYKGILSSGYHYVAWLESSTATGTTTWQGASTFKSAGISATIPM